MRPRGAVLSPRHVLAASFPHRIVGATPPQFAVVPSRLSMWDNDRDGDCVTAEEAFKCACHNPEIFIQDSEVIRWASAHGVLNGADLSQVLDWMRQSGFQQDGVLYNDGPKTAVDWTNPSVLCNAIAQGPVKIAVAANQLEKAVGNSNGWFGVGFHQDQNIDHCVSLSGYGPISWLAQQLGVSVPSGVNGSAQGYHLFTWSTIGIVDVPSMLAITAEAWLRTPSTVIVGPTPPTPVPPTPTPVPPTPTPPPSGVTLAQVLACDKDVFNKLVQVFRYIRNARSVLASAEAALEAEHKQLFGVGEGV